MITETNKKELTQLNPLLEGHKGFIAGGCFKDIFENKEPKDINIFFRNKNDYEEAHKTFLENGFTSCTETQNAVTLVKGETTKVQLIKTIYNTPEKLLNGFDFTVCKYAYFKKENDYVSVCCDSYYADLKNKTLKIDYLLNYPYSSLVRAFRYSGYGFCPTANTISKLTLGIRDMEEDEFFANFYQEEGK